jgi:CheY-like chemotaxis protein
LPSSSICRIHRKGLSFPIGQEKDPVGENENENLLVEEVQRSFDKYDKVPAILLVEDNDEMRYYLKEILGDSVTIHETINGREALKWLKTNTPDLILSDVMMPEMDGYEFLHQLKSDAQLKRIPAVMLTARASEEDLLHGLSLGVDDYIIKPFNAIELKIRIHNPVNQSVDPETMAGKTCEGGSTANAAINP